MSSTHIVLDLETNSKFERTNSANINAWYSLPRSTIKINLYSQNILQTNNDKIEILGCDLNINYNIFGNWILSGYLRHLSNPNILSDGIGDLLEFTLSGNENLFNNNMILFFEIGLTGWVNRKSHISFNPFYCTPISILDPNFISVIKSFIIFSDNH